MTSVSFFHVFTVNNSGKCPRVGFSSFFIDPGGRGFELSFYPGGGKFAHRKHCLGMVKLGIADTLFLHWIPGGGRVTQPLWFSRIFGPRSVKFWLVLGASLNVSENVKLIEYLMFLHDGNCSMTWWFSWLFFRNHNRKQAFYKCLNKLQLASANRRFLSDLSGLDVKIHV